MTDTAETITLVVCDEAASTPIMTIIMDIAAREKMSPTDLPPLHSAIDCDALNALVDSLSATGSDRSGSVRFTYYGYEVSVDSAGDVTIPNSHDEASGQKAEADAVDSVEQALSPSETAD